MNITFTSEKLSLHKELTPEGFLLCKSVVIARTGTQYYAADEIPELEAKDGVVEIYRSPDEVFRPETLLSFNGKPVTVNHPLDGVDVYNWQRISVGVTLNPRRDGESLVADLIIYDKAAIDYINGHNPDISCGYSTDYHSTAKGKGVQTNILGNHVALVHKGRCGETCKIRDEGKSMDEVTLEKKVREWIRDAMEEKKEEKDDDEEEKKEEKDEEEKKDDDEPDESEKKTTDAETITGARSLAPWFPKACPIPNRYTQILSLSAALEHPKTRDSVKAIIGDHSLTELNSTDLGQLFATAVRVCRLKHNEKLVKTADNVVTTKRIDRNQINADFWRNRGNS